MLDFNLSTARDSTSARLFNKLQAVKVAWPASLPEPVATGPFKGLYRIDNKWHVTVAGLLFRVSVVPGFSEVYGASSIPTIRASSSKPMDTAGGRWIKG